MTTFGLDANPIVEIVRDKWLDRYVLNRFGSIPTRRHSQSILKVATTMPSATPAGNILRTKSQPNLAVTLDPTRPVPSSSNATPTRVLQSIQSTSSSSPSSIGQLNPLNVLNSTPTTARARPITRMIINRLNSKENSNVSTGLSNVSKKTFNNFDPFKPMGNLAFALSGRRRSTSAEPPAKVPRKNTH